VETEDNQLKDAPGEKARKFYWEELDGPLILLSRYAQRAFSGFHQGLLSLRTLPFELVSTL
jgi:hypothetical protein